jgi:hypothetical protein
MASPEAWLRGAIEDAANCNAYPVGIPEGATPPYVSYSREGTERVRDLEGGAGAPVGEFLISVFADSYLDAKAAADLIRAGLVNFNGTEEDCTIDDVRLNDEKDGDPIYMDGRDVPTYVVEQTYSIFWQE